MVKKIILLSFGVMLASFSLAQNGLNKGRFIHPGMLQSHADLELMKKNISEGIEPWKTAFENLEIEVNLNFQVIPFTHVSSGAYGANDKGGRSFSESGKNAYRNALMWYITNDKIYANKAIEIINAWSYKLWSFDGNNAKLLVGLFAPDYLNAAEILKYTDSGWQEKDIEQFSSLIRRVLYPTIKDFFAEANGNWDGSMIYSMMCMGVFLDDHDMLQKAVDHFYYGSGNGGITKYIYPTGQCQETTRDWDHVQLGLGEFAKAAQIAWSQGLDLYSVANNRLALGFEHTAKVLMGDCISVFGTLSQRDKEISRDIYESVYEHYEKVKGIAMPYTSQYIQKYTRKHSSVGVLTGLRAPKWTIEIENKRPLSVNFKAKQSSLCGALKESHLEVPKNHIYIKSGKSIQRAIDKYANSSAPVCIVLGKGVHWLKEPLRLKSNIVLVGKGKETVLILEKDIEAATIVNASSNLCNVTIRDLLIEGAENIETPFDPNYERTQRLYNAKSRGGIYLQGDTMRALQNLRVENVTIQNFTKNGIFISGADNVTIINCDISDNGSSVVPGPSSHHNISLSHVTNCDIKGCRADASLWGNGLSIFSGGNIQIIESEFARNKLSGIYCAESENIQIFENLIEGNDQYGVFFNYLDRGSFNIKIEDNLIQLNGKKGVFIENSSFVFPENNLRDNRISLGLSHNHAMHPEKQIEFVKQQIQNRKEPYFSAYKQLIHYADSVCSFSHHALVNFSVPGFYEDPDVHRNNSLAIQTDAFASYCLALAYRLSENEKYGEKAIHFLNAWAHINKNYSEHDGALVMSYSGVGFLIGAELLSESCIWNDVDKAVFSKWISSVYKKAVNEIRVHKNNWADWGRFGSLLAASLLNDDEEVKENIVLIKSDVFQKIAEDGSMPEETKRGNNGIWYTYFSLAPMTASAWLIRNLTEENLFELEYNGTSVKKAIDYLLYYTQYPSEWSFHQNPNTGESESWPENLIEAMSGVYNDEKYITFNKSKQPIIYPKHHFAWVFPTLMPIHF